MSGATSMISAACRHAPSHKDASEAARNLPKANEAQSCSSISEVTHHVPKALRHTEKMLFSLGSARFTCSPFSNHVSFT
eukprot:599157-Amphidinium_carterae.1